MVAAAREPDHGDLVHPHAGDRLQEIEPPLHVLLRRRVVVDGILGNEAPRVVVRRQDREPEPGQPPRLGLDPVVEPRAAVDEDHHRVRPGRLRDEQQGRHVDIAARILHLPLHKLDGPGPRDEDAQGTDDQCENNFTRRQHSESFETNKLSPWCCQALLRGWREEGGGERGRALTVEEPEGLLSAR